MSRGYADKSSLKLVGDRFDLTERQRLAVMRSACGDQALVRRIEHRLEPSALREQHVLIDGFNLLTTLEAALSGGVILHGRDGCFRDMVSMHGSYRKVHETIPAIMLVGEFLATRGAASAMWLLDRPVSNSGRLKTILGDLAADQGWQWEVDLVHDPDPLLSAAKSIVITADSAILDNCQRWCNAARAIVEEMVSDPWVLDLSRSMEPY